jgi:rhodanese-related sulfurtransferase
MRQFDTPSGVIAGTFAERSAAAGALAALRNAGFTTAHLGLDDKSPVLKVRRAIPRPSPLFAALAGGATAVVLEATIFSVPPAVPTVMGGSLIAATVGILAGIAIAAVIPVGALAEHEPDLLTELRRGRSVLTVNARGRVRRERARGILRQHGASRTIDVDAEEEVRFARPLSDAEPRLRLHCEERYGADRWDELLPAYVFGWDRANRPDLNETLWNDAMPRLREDWEHRHPETPWSDVDEAVLAAWEKARALEASD